MDACKQARQTSASFLTQQIMQAHKSDHPSLYRPESADMPGFQCTVEILLSLGMLLYCNHQWRIKKKVDVLSEIGVGVLHQRVNQMREYSRD